MGQTLTSFCSIQTIFTVRIVTISGTQTWIVGEEDKHTDNWTTLKDRTFFVYISGTLV